VPFFPLLDARRPVPVNWKDTGAKAVVVLSHGALAYQRTREQGLQPWPGCDHVGARRPILPSIFGFFWKLLFAPPPCPAGHHQGHDLYLSLLEKSPF
jgi:hypothetical protein